MKMKIKCCDCKKRIDKNEAVQFSDDEEFMCELCAERYIEKHCEVGLLLREMEIERERFRAVN